MYDVSLRHAKFKLTQFTKFVANLQLTTPEEVLIKNRNVLIRLVLSETAEVTTRPTGRNLVGPRYLLEVSLAR